MRYRFLLRFALGVLLIIMGANLLQTNFPFSACFASSESVVVAKVNDEIHITRAEFEQVLNQFQRKIGMRPVTKEEKIEIVKSLIRRHLILKQDALEALRQSPQIVAKVKQFEDQLVIKQYLEEEVGSQINITDAELKGYYDTNRHRFSSPAKVEASHILLRSQLQAEQIKARLQNGGDFVQLAKDYSIDLPMALEGGKMGTIEKGKTVSELEEALFTMEEGATSDIIKTRFGYHILRVDKIYPPNFKPFEEVREQIKNALMRQKEAKAFNEMAAELENNADIEIFEDRILEISDSAYLNQILKKNNDVKRSQ